MCGERHDACGWYTTFHHLDVTGARSRVISLAGPWIVTCRTRTIERMRPSVGYVTGQRFHAIALAFLLIMVAATARMPCMLEGSAGGVPTFTWFVASIGVAIAHQVYVWWSWRAELLDQRWTRVFGNAAFSIYATGFAVLILARPVTVCVLAYANRDTLPLANAFTRTLAILLALPAIYLGWSVARYSGFRRATGLDHFDPRARELPFVRMGIFAWTPNAMYVFGFLWLWIPALWFGSAAAVVASAFQHAYIWVHYLATERPDMRVLYPPGFVPGQVSSRRAR